MAKSFSFINFLNSLLPTLSQSNPLSQIRKAISDTRIERIIHGLREIALLCYLALSLYLLLSLLTFDLEDPGWRHTGTGRPLANVGGLIGAWLADVALSLLGVTAFLIPLILAWHGFRVYQRCSTGSRILLTLRWLGCVTAVLAGSGLAYVHLVWLPLGLPETAGGIIGAQIGEWLIKQFGTLGATLALLLIFLTGATLFSDLSWINLIKRVGKHLISAWNLLCLKYQSLSSQILHRELKSFTRPREQARKVKREPKVRLIEKLAEVSVLPEPAAMKAQSTVSRKSAPRPVVSSFVAPSGDSMLPPLDLLDQNETVEFGYSEDDLALMSRHVESVLSDFGVQAEVREIHPGPVITRFEIKPGPGIKGSRISNLSTDLARQLAVPSVRVVEVIPGKPYVGLEIPNRQRATVYLREILASPEYQQAKSPVTLVLGKDISGRPVLADLAKMPHLLVAGTTGSGKSVAINAMILSIVYKARPQEVRMIMIDPKMLELSVYEGIPHLLSPVVTDMKEAASALRWCVAEMERRYRLMSALKVRGLISYNRKVQEAIDQGEPIKDPLFRASDLKEGQHWPILESLPIIVVVIDELADMMMVVGKKVEELIARLAQKARAAGIHLILATQRPSVDVLTGLIKANIPTRIAFQVSSKVDSRTILDQSGAEALLGCGDMLYLPPGSGFPLRAHGAFVGDHEVLKVVEYLKQAGPPKYIEDITRFQEDSELLGKDRELEGERDPLYDEAVRFVTETRRVSISSIQRKFKIGYNRAARIVEDMERAGIVSAAEGNGARSVLAPPVED